MNLQTFFQAAVLACGVALVAPGLHAQRAFVPQAAPPQQLAAVPLASADLEFMLAAAAYADAGIASAQLALARADAPRIRALAQRMLQDHRDTRSRLQEIAAATGVALPRGSNSEQRLVLAGLRALRGDAFERDFLQRAAINEHRELILLMHRQATGAGRDPELARLATRMLPRLQEHVAVAQTLHDAEMAGSAAASGRGG